MASDGKAIQVGALDPELKSSPIMEEGDEDFDVLAQEVEDLPTCFYNNISYKTGQYVCSGSTELLQCRNGLWVQVGSCDPDNP